MHIYGLCDTISIVIVERKGANMAYNFDISAKRLMEAVDASTCAFTAADEAMRHLEQAGFNELKLSEDWIIEKGKGYFINVYDSSVFAFKVGKSFDRGMLRVAAAHTDHPCLYIKPSPEMTTKGYGKINVEVYGGAILNTWLDRPLSVAGKVALKNTKAGEKATWDDLKPTVKIVDFKKPIFTIPNLAIHMNREVNKGVELNKQTDMAPLATILEDEMNKDSFFMEYLAKQLRVAVEDILDFELYVYNTDKAERVGMNEEMISAPRLDNITSVVACVQGIISADRADGINVIALYDNEEIGSRTKQGADSNMLGFILEKLYETLGYSRKDYMQAATDGFLLSIDVAHALHPNKAEKSDPTNTNMMNDGIVIKRASSQTYATDCETIAMIEMICQANDIPYQKFACRSDGTTGSTLGTLANKYMPMRTIDVGVPILAMHSSRELMGVKDQAYMEKLVEAYFGA